jgi:hypothetical protein
VKYHEPVVALDDFTVSARQRTTLSLGRGCLFGGAS